MANSDQTTRASDRGQPIPVPEDVLPSPLPEPRALGPKALYFVLEALNAFATTFYFYYLFFFLQQQFAFSNKLNLVYASFNGLIYMLGSWYGGRFGQKQGYFSALTIGFAGMMLVLLLGAFSETILVHTAVLALWTLTMSFTWPALEALVSENEPRGNLPRMVGLYNLVWAGGSAVAYFVGGAILEALGPKSFFLVPAAIHLLQLILLFCFPRPKNQPSEQATPDIDEPHPVPNSRLFLRLAWVANPFAYVAINSLVPMIPFLAQKLQLSPMLAGFFCSLWLFARFIAFSLLFLYSGWHYRFNWLLYAFLAMMGCFVVLLLSPNLWVLILAQVVFGLAIGLIYYSSLYYAMDVGDTKGEHGGLHEAAIGIGNFAGPALSAGALQLFPTHPQSGTWSVCGLLIVGLTMLLIIGRQNGMGSNARLTFPSATGRVTGRSE